MPPRLPPTAASSRSMPRERTSSAWTLTMSSTVITGKSRPQGCPVSGQMLLGPVVPWQPPRTFAQITKYLSVSSPLPGPIKPSHQPALRAARSSLER